MSLSLKTTSLHRFDMVTRMPFKYGIATLTHLPHIFVTVEAEIDGVVQRGTCADHLPPKWFTKVPEKDAQTEIDEMLAVIRAALEKGVAITAGSVFGFWIQLYEAMDEWGAARKFPPLLTHFGTSLVERALMDAFCRAKGTTFAAALEANIFGIDLGRLRPYIVGRTPGELLEKPLKRMILRHTVGLSDPLSETDIAPEDRLGDGLPQSLEENIRYYGLKHFKIKVNGQPDTDLARLRALAEIIQRECGGDYGFSLDGNEQFRTGGDFRVFWEDVQADAALKSFFKKLIFIEQPFHRDVAFDKSVVGLFAEWPKRPPIIIDESDGALDSLPRALDWGYAGTSHKNCKGVIKGIANRCLLNALKQREPVGKYMMSAEDLVNVGPVALLQDLTVQACLGNASVERNGHHYFRGLSMFPPSVQALILEKHGDLYEVAPEGWPRVKATAGELAVGSLLAAPFGCDFELPLDEFAAI